MILSFFLPPVLGHAFTTIPSQFFLMPDMTVCRRDPPLFLFTTACCLFFTPGICGPRSSKCLAKRNRGQRMLMSMASRPKASGFLFFFFCVNLEVNGLFSCAGFLLQAGTGVAYFLCSCFLACFLFPMPYLPSFPFFCGYSLAVLSLLGYGLFFFFFHFLFRLSFLPGEGFASVPVRLD